MIRISTSIGTFDRVQLIACLHNLGEEIPDNVTDEQLKMMITRQISGVMEGNVMSEDEAIKGFKAEYRFCKDLVN